MDMISLYNENKLKIWIIILVGIPSILVLGYFLLPDLFWDSFLWKYFWGPVAADAKDKTINGISEGYNIVNTVTYGICILIAFFGIYELVEHFDVKIDKRFLISLLPWVALGGSLRSLEDVGFFKEPLNQLFISPIIYFVLGISAITAMVIGAYIDKKDSGMKKEALLRMLMFIPPAVVLYFINSHLSEQLSWVYLLFFVSLIIITSVGWVRRWMDETYLFTLYGSSSLIFTFSVNYHYITSLKGTNPLEAVIIPLMSVGVTLLFLGTWKLVGVVSKNKQIPAAFLGSLNILIAWSHFFDASATYRGIEFYGYLEKHVLPGFAIDLTGTPLVMFVLKLVLVIAAIYLLDILFDEEFIEYPYLKNLIKFVIIVLGAAPAVRNTLRLAMGV